MKRMKGSLAIILCVLVFMFSFSFIIPVTQEVGVANIVVTSVYWGANPQIPEYARPGDVNKQLSITLSNRGEDVARGVTAVLYLKPPLKYIYYQDGQEYSSESVSKAAGDIQPGSSFILTYTLSIDENAKEGNYPFDLELSYRSARELQQIKKVEQVDIPIWWGNLLVQSVNTDPLKIYPGKNEVNIRVTIVNSGTGIASNVQLWMDVKDPFVVSSSSSDNYFVGQLTPGQAGEAIFVIDVTGDARAGKYSLIIYEERSIQHIPIGEVPLYVNEKVLFEIVEVSPITFYPGDSGDVIRLELKNTGSVKAESVRVQLRVGNFFSGTLTDFLGTMLPGEVKIAFFTVDIDSKAPVGMYNFDLRLDWTQDGTTLDDTQTISFELTPQTYPITPFIVILIIVVGIIVFVIWRRRRKKTVQTS